MSSLPAGTAFGPSGHFPKHDQIVEQGAVEIKKKELRSGEVDVAVDTRLSGSA